ncbi:G-protein coupled receptor 39 [Protopterus annectens]|uniref:G-protein coupled receptor 39 n=1 Tax=Protopterus annectens TaxID=7888 RepID=UPI001CFB4FC5|nr:G-protein coupled receptor 39 [Protopterus annectens]
MMPHRVNCSGYLKEVDIKRFKLSRDVQVSLSIIYIIIFLIGVSGNLITVTVTQVLQKKGYLQKAVTDHMISLACSDLLVLLLGMPVQLYSAVWKPYTSGTLNSACKIYSFLFEACSYATIFNVATLSFERYTAICRPFHYKSLTGTRTIVIICLVWFASLLVGLPQIFATGIVHPLEGRIHNCTRRLRRLTENISICTNLADQQVVYQASIYGAFIIYLFILVSVAFMCQKMVRTLAAMQRGTVPITRGTEKGKKVQFLSKREKATAHDSRKQTIIVLGKETC